ncbi:MAG: HD domain-containing protein [Actinomycetota bacterium]|nr:HD domain-containing protein [Actinomycetota bacterium]
MSRFKQDNLFYAAVLLTVVALVYLVASAVGDGLGPGRPAMIVMALAVGAALLALAGWHVLRRNALGLIEAERAAREAAQREVQAREAELEKVARERSQVEQEKQQVEAALGQKQGEAEQLRSQRDELDRLTDEKQSEVEELQAKRARLSDVNSMIREWNRQLRSRIAELQKENGPLADPGDVPAMVLQLATTLLEGEKGLLLSRQDGDGDSDLDLLAAQGFENDPEHSDIAQRFAREVIDQDTTIREDQVPEGKSAADKEIENLVAIPIYVQDEFSGVVVCANREGGFEEFDDEVLLALGDHTGAILNNARLRGDLRNSYIATIRLIADALEAKDPFLRDHSDEVSAYVAAVGQRLGLEGREREELLFGSLLHDVGKLGISERILLKPASLTPEERSVIELHPRIGYRLVQQVPALQNIAPAILHHHERFDGSGYPQGLRGEQIPLQARIIAVADSFSAMTSDRPYRKAMSVEEACAELERCAGEQFDPEVVRVFIEEVRRRPPGSEGVNELAVALADAELEVRRGEDEPILGYDSYAVTDNLTLLYSHRYFHEMAKAEAQRATLQSIPFSIVMVELSEIDRVNKENGYAAGDEQIRKTAAAVQRAAARCSGFACRYSGRRLALIAPRVDEREGGRLASEIAAELEGDPVVRIGVCEWRQGDDVHAMVARAETELQQDALSPAPAPTTAI